MKPTDDAQRPTAGELMSDEELNPPAQGGASLSRDEAEKLAQDHREAVAEGRAKVGEADPNSGRNAQDHGGTIHPKGG
jgi:hypothetical protein